MRLGGVDLPGLEVGPVRRTGLGIEQFKKESGPAARTYHDSGGAFRYVVRSALRGPGVYTFG
jgi:hypothetical protein